MNFIYNLEEVKRSVTCEQYLNERGIAIRNGNRFNAVWRGGDSFSCSFDGSVFHDHKEGKGDSVIGLCMLVEGLSIQAAIKTLGDRFRVTPFKTIREAPKISRGEMLVKDGFSLVATYPYEEADGTPRYFVDRYEKMSGGEKVKEFVQRSLVAENLHGVKRLPYNLPAVVKSDIVYIVEGEKDVETLRRLGLVGTTNSGGGRHWDPDFNKYFAGKDVVILPDNDEVGREHGMLVYSMMKPIAKSCRIATVSKLPKGDVTDFMEKEGGTLVLLNDAIKNAEQPANAEDSPSVAAAKLANADPFSNYSEVQDGKKTKRVPKQMNAILDDVNRRFLGFPRTIGSAMFDWNKDEKKIVNITDKDNLFAWIQGVSRNIVNWETGIGFTTKAELYCRILQTATNYQCAVRAPFFPPRKTAFPMYDALPNADQTHYKFWELVDKFNPANEANRLLLAAFFCAPMFYDGIHDRPAWVIDTDDGQGSGKTTVAKMCALLYDEEPIGVDLRTIEYDFSQFKKRLVSTEGRQRRMVLFDNITKTFRNENLASMITEKTISERAAYGRGEESRANDLTIVATMNGASVDTDMATRCYALKIKAVAKPKPGWDTEVTAFIIENRRQIWADMIDMMTHANTDFKRGKSRFSTFDSVVVAAVCKNLAEFRLVDEEISKGAVGANEDADIAEQFEEIVLQAVVKFKSDGVDGTGFDENIPAFFRYNDLEKILSHSDSALKSFKKHHIRMLVRSGKLPNWSKKLERFPDGFNGLPRSRGMFFGMDRMDDDLDGTTRVQFVTFNDVRVPRVIATVRINRSLVSE